MYTDSLHRLYVESMLIIFIVFDRAINHKFEISFHGLNKSHQEAVVGGEDCLHHIFPDSK